MISSANAGRRNFGIPVGRCVLVTLGLGALVVGALTSRFGSVVILEGSAIALFALWRGVQKANKWIQSGDLFAPAVAFPLAYIAWFSLGSANIFDLPAHYAFGLFEPVPASMWTYYCIGLGGYFVGILLVRPGVWRPSEQASVENSWDPSRFWFVVRGLLAVMVASYALLVARVGVKWLEPVGEEERTSAQGIPHFLFISCAWTVLVLIPAYVWSRPVARRVKIAAVLLLVATVVLLLSIGGRTNLAVPIITAAFIFHYLQRRFSLKSVILFSVAGIACLSLMGYAKEGGFERGNGAGWFADLGVPPWVVWVGYSLLYVRYSVATFRDLVAMVPATVPYQFGALTLTPFKSFLPGRHESYDLFIKHILGNDFSGAGQAATLLGPLYIDFGILGIFGGLLLLGVIVAKTYKKMARQRRLIHVIAYAWVIQVWLYSLHSSLFPFPTTLTIPLLWFGLDWFMAKPKLALIHGATSSKANRELQGGGVAG